MKRNLFLSLSFLFVLSACAQDFDRESVRKVKDAMVFIEVVHDHPLQDRTVEGSGSGFFVDEHGRIATNNHVISPWVSAMGLPYPAPVESITAFVNSGSDSVQKVPLRVLYRNAERDLALLTPKKKVEVPGHLEVRSDPDLYETMSVWAFGYPHGMKHSVLQTGPEVTVTEGSISALRHGDRDTLRAIQMDASVAPGNSGGPLVNTEGEALGVVFRRGENKMNEAVPGHFLQEMIDRLPKAPFPEKLSLTLKSEPKGAQLFIDGVAQGSTPFHSDSLAAGSHRIDLYHKEQRALFDELVLIGDTSITLKTEPIGTRPLERNLTPEKEASETPSLRTVNSLIQEDFDDPERFRSWEQNTGGVSERTWYLKEGRLRQYQRDGTLHAITLQKVDQSPYRISARVTLPGQGEGDDRAGLIFGDDRRGFYLFRIYRGSNKAELAYHSRSPFGWTILQQESLDRNIDMDEWYELSVSVLGDRVLCHLDGKKLIDLRVPALNAGKVGFYSVESRPAFDSLRVEHLELESPLEERKGSPGTESFWFTDRFNRSSGWWWPATGDSLHAPFVSEVGTSVRAEGQEWHRMNFRRYELSDMQVRAIISTDEGGDSAGFEWSFLEKEDGSRMALRFGSDSILCLLHIHQGKEEVLKSDTLTNSFFGGPSLFRFQLDGRDLELGTRFGTEFKGQVPEDVELGPGSFSFALRDLHGIFHRMTVSSLDRAEEEGE